MKLMRRLFILACFALGIASAIYFVVRGKAPAEPTPQQREQAYLAAIQQATTDENWPGTARELIEEFWTAASVKNYDRMTVLCPGSMPADFKRHYEYFTPSAAKQIGPAEKSNDPNIQLFAVKLDFPGFKNKTVKMAVRMDQQRFVIDGQRTIWW